MQRKHRGFTLLEILLVIAAIGILAAIVLVAINPNRQIALAQNSRRSNDVGAIYKALQQYNIDNERYPAAIEAMDTGFADRVDICQFGQVSINCLDVSSDLTPTYLADIPEDPSGATSTSTRYSVIKNLNNTIAVRSEEAQLGREIIAGVILDGGGTLNAPSAIGDLSAQVIGGNSVQLTWSAPASPLPISEYIVIYSSGQNFSSETIIDGITNTTYLVENLNIGIYEFKVIAVNAEAQGADSNIVQGVLCGSGTCIDYGGNDWIISSNQTVSGLHYNIDTFRVNSGITASTALGTNFAVYANQYQGLGNINASGLGYRGGRDGHGGDNGLGPGGGGIDSGGGHGATGGGPAGGVQYGSVSQPVELGSGGGHQPSYGVTGGRGGGAIKIITSGDIEVAGSVLANGAAGVGTYYSGGAGGSIWLQSGGQLRGAGTVSAIGGPAFGAFGGAGGRIALYYGTNTFSGTISANGGNGTSGIGGAGTIWQGNLASGARLLTISNGDLGTVNNPVTRIDNGSFTETALQNFTIAGRANVVLDKSIDIGNNSLSLASNSRLTQNVQLNAGTSATINIGGIWVLSGLVVGGNVTVQSGGLITHMLNPAVGTKQVGIDMSLTSFIVQNGGNIDVTGLGYRGGQDGHSGDNGLGPGGGVASGAGGGGYGGSGGAAGGGAQYGSVSEPVELGSGGAREMSYGSTGGRGGGAIKIVTSGDIEIAGNMRSNGSTGTGWYYTAGSGGSIWLQAGGQLRGAGVIQSNGGDSFAGGSGSGGRIALYYGTNTFSGTITANAGNGTGGTIGGAGTIWQGNLVSGARLLTISNGDLGTVNNPITRIDNSSFTETILQNFTIAGRANVVLDKNLTIGNTNFSIASNSRFTQNALIVGPSMASFSLGSGAVWQQNSEMTGGVLTSMNIAGTWIRDITQVFNQSLAVLTVANGGLITHSIHPVSGTKQRGLDMSLGGLVVQSGGNINVTGLGYRGGQDGHSGDNGLGPGGGVNAGGGHGGVGGGPGGGSQYGSLMNPVDLGSGGGRDNFYVSTGGRGGGAIKIVVIGDIEVAGNILANGVGGTGTYYTGGSGGSIWLQAGGQLRGAGVIQSNGGGAFGAPGGGGGRIALYYGTNIFSGSVTATGANGGGTGSIY